MISKMESLECQVSEKKLVQQLEAMVFVFENEEWGQLVCHRVVVQNGFDEMWSLNDTIYMKSHY